MVQEETRNELTRGHNGMAEGQGYLDEHKFEG